MQGKIAIEEHWESPEVDTPATFGFIDADYLAHEVPGVTIPASALDVLERAGRGAARAAGLELAASLLVKAKSLVSGVVLTAPDDDAGALDPLLDALGCPGS